MSVAIFEYDSTQITLGHDSYGIWSGGSTANVKRFARTLGGYLKPTKRVEKTVSINSYMIPPA